MRAGGILMHLSSLPSPYGIGTMGKAAFEFVDFLEESGQKYWQLLPVCPTGYGDSPYQSYCTFAGNPYFIDLDLLEKEGFLDKQDYADIDWGTSPKQVDFGLLYQKRYPILQKATKRFLQSPSKDFEDFCEKNAFWLDDFARFMSMKGEHGGASESEWKVLQYLFFAQWKNLKKYANDKGISIIGDLPIYVSLDSVDVWAHPELFQLDENGIPKEVAGCPPDGFSKDGQLWGNPLYDWEYMEAEGFTWWIRRIQYLCEVYDILRIDHFRGFESYYAIPYGDPTAQNGHWKKGPGMKLFRAVEEAIGKRPIIAEDLGHVTDDVRKLLKDSGFPGMKVLQFAFDRRDENSVEYLPHHFIEHCVAYTGTHDNDTILGWFREADVKDAAYAKDYLNIPEGAELNWSMMDVLWDSVAELTIVQAQDLLGLGNEARMNKPSTVGKNWRWRALPGAFTKELAQKVKERMELYQRLG